MAWRSLDVVALDAFGYSTQRIAIARLWPLSTATVRLWPSLAIALRFCPCGSSPAKETITCVRYPQTIRNGTWLYRGGLILTAQEVLARRVPR